MLALPFRSAALALAVVTAITAAEPAATPAPAPAAPPTTEALIRARQAERIKGKVGVTSPRPALSPTAAPVNLPAPTAAQLAAAAAAATAPAPSTPADLAQSRTETPELLPKVEVRRGRATAIEREVFEQERDIAREKANAKSSDADRALNDTKRSFSLFGGQTTKQRETVAKERVSLMEAERDLMEAIAYAKTPAEKDALRKELNELKALRRDLESALR